MNVKNQEVIKRQQNEIEFMKEEAEKMKEALRNAADPGNAPTVVADREAYRAHISKLNDEI